MNVPDSAASTTRRLAYRSSWTLSTSTDRDQQAVGTLANCGTLCVVLAGIDGVIRYGVVHPAEGVVECNVEITGFASSQHRGVVNPLPMIFRLSSKCLTRTSNRPTESSASVMTVPRISSSTRQWSDALTEFIGLDALPHRLRLARVRYSEASGSWKRISNSKTPLERSSEVVPIRVSLNGLHNTGSPLVGKVAVDTDIAEAFSHLAMDPVAFKNRISSLPRSEWIAQLPAAYSYDAESETHTIFGPGELPESYNSREAFEADWVPVKRPSVTRTELLVPGYTERSCDCDH